MLFTLVKVSLGTVLRICVISIGGVVFTHWLFFIIIGSLVSEHLTQATAVGLCLSQSFFFFVL